MANSMKKAALTVLLVPALTGMIYAEQGGKGPPPAAVVVADVTRGEAEPMAAFVGTVYYSRVSRVASEVEGRVRHVDVQVGDRVRKGQRLLRLSTDLMETSLEGTRAAHEQALVELEKAEKDFRRMESLYKEDSVAEAVLDDHYFSKLGLQKKAATLEAALERLLLQKRKMTINSPFDGVVMEKTVEEGEWVPTGGTVAVVADDMEVDVVLDVPAGMLGYLKKGREFDVMSGGGKLKGRFMSLVPKGDVATRTFSVKLRVRNSAGLIEGMEASASLPSGMKTPGLLVPRDALINMFGQDVVFVVVESRASMVSVRVMGYDGAMAGVEAIGPAGSRLREGVKVVVKGNERLRDGQEVRMVGQ
jgi:RND family efflux transporter MFP subunit